MSVRIGKAAEAPPFQEAARHALEDSQLRHNMRHATRVIRNKRNNIVGELPDWEQLRASTYTGRVMPMMRGRSFAGWWSSGAAKRSSR